MKKKIIKCLTCSLLLVGSVSAWGNSRIEYILDVSGSMNALSGGEKRIDAAKKSITSMVQGIPDGTFVALRFYSHRIPPSDKVTSCKDTELLIPFGPINKAQFLGVVNNANPLGQTPIAYTLEQVANDFQPSASETQSIILVSDGQESCGGDPVAVAKDLLARGYNLKIHVIGMDVDANAKNQLALIASTTGGQYFDAKDTTSLTASLQQLTQASLVIQKAGSSVYGEEIRGGDNYETAVPLPIGKLFRLNHHQKENEYDYFYVDAKPGQKIITYLETGEKGVTIKPDNSYEENDHPYAGISLHNPQKTAINGADGNIIGDRNNSKQLIYPVPIGGAGRHFILVGTHHGAQHKDHRFKVDIVEQFDAGSQQDAGENRETAVPIQPGTFKGFLNSNDELDTFRVTLPSGPLNIRARPVNESVKLELSLFDADGVKVAAAEAPNAGAVAKIEATTKGGEHILKVKNGCCISTFETEYSLEIMATAVPTPSADVDLGAPPAPAAASIPTTAPTASPNTPLPSTASLPEPISPKQNIKGESSEDILQLFKILPLAQQAKALGLYSGIPFLVGGLIAGLWGYLKGRNGGKCRDE